MSVVELLEQAKNLSLQERKELAKLLIDTLDDKPQESRAKTGAEIVALLKTMPAIEFLDAEIEDPVDWVKAQRQKRKNQLMDIPL